MFNNQFEFNFDWYEATSEALHYGVKVPSSGGFTNDRVNMNASTMINSGLEFLFTYRNYNHAVKFDYFCQCFNTIQRGN